MNGTELIKYAESLCGKDWVSLDQHPDLIEAVMKHEDFSHVSHRNRYSLSIYYCCDGSPSGVSLFASIDIKDIKKLVGHNERFDAIEAALYINW